MRTKLGVFCEKIIEAGWLAVVISVPLFFNIYSARTFEPDKITLLRAIVSIMVLAWIISVVEKGGESNGQPVLLAERVRNWLKTPLFLPTAVLVLVYIISTIFSISPRVSLWGSYQRLQGTYSALSYIVVFALIAGNLRTRQQLERLIVTIIITSVPVSLYGIVQRYGLDPLPWAGDVTTRVASNMGNAIFVASYLIMIVPLTITRLVESMTAIIREENASWAYTVLSAVYIFVLAVQIITIIFSGSRGPMLGILAASFIVGLLIVLILRQLDNNPARLSLKEIAGSIAFTIPLGLAGGIGGGLGYLVGAGLEILLTNLNYQVGNVALVGAAIGGLLGFFGLYVFMAASERGWRWLWLSWFALGALGVTFVLLLNIRGFGFDPYLNPVRQLPGIEPLSRITAAESGSGRVRVLIWDAVVNLVVPHRPLGVANDEVTGQDNFNFLRPWIGYGPESMFNAFAFVYPPELAYVESRGSSADRSHNETMDSLVITGILGFLAFYYMMVSLFYYALRWLGWIPDKVAGRGLIIILLVAGLCGAAIPWLVDSEGGPFTFVPIGLPFGLVVGIIIYLTWQALIRQPEVEDAPRISENSLLLIGLLGGLIGHFIEVHFVFSIAATYTYFWVYAGLLVAASRIKGYIPVTEMEAAIIPDVTATEPVGGEPPQPVSRRRKSRGRRGKRSIPTVNTGNWSRSAPVPTISGESLETAVGGQGLAMAIILIILTFDFITPQFQFNFSDKNSLSLLWMFTITWFIGLALAISQLVTQHDDSQRSISWGRAVLLYLVTSLSYFLFYYLVHRMQLGQQIVVTTIDDVISAANVLTNALIIFYVALLVLMTVFALILGWRQFKRLPLWRSENWWLYPPLVAAVLVVILFKNIDVVRADIYLKEGERYRNSGQWDQAIALHREALSRDRDEDFYYLMLALDYQLMAQDGNLDPALREFAWQEGERIALEARRINPFNPDNTGNMGRYYFTLGQIVGPEKFQQALDFFAKATELAPSNITYQNLWAQTLYILQDYEATIDRLEQSLAIDSNYPPTWLLLGDTQAALGNVDEALEAHSRSMRLNVNQSDGFAGFADQFLDQRLSFYISAGRVDEIIAAMQEVATERPDNPLIPWAIGHAYILQGQYEQAIPFLEQSLALVEDPGQNMNAVRELANTYLTLNRLEQALSYYQFMLENNPNNIEAHSALAFIYAQQGFLDKAIQHNQLVLQQVPNDYDSLKNLAILYQQTGQLEEAKSAAEQAMAVAPEEDVSSWQQFISDIENQLKPPG